MKKKLAIITTHPIQYNAPMFRLLNERDRICIKVYYTWGEAAAEKKWDPGFQREVAWDLPLLDGYDFAFTKNSSAKPGSHHFRGIINPDLIKEIEQFHPDAVLIYGWSFKSHLKAMRYFHGKIPVLFRGDSIVESKGGMRALIKRIVLQSVYRHIDFALYTGKRNLEYFKLAGVKVNKLRHAPHAVDNTRFATDRSGDFREELNISKDTIVFLFAGKFEPKKDPLTLVQAFKSVAKAFPGRCVLLLAGNGELEAEMKAAAQDHPSIRFLDFQNQQSMPALYSSCDVFVLPSQGPGETWGLAVNEAMAAGKAVIVSDRCGCAPDLVAAGENGYVFPAGDADALEKCMRIFIQDANQVKKLGEASRQKIKDWSFERICTSVEHIIQNEI